MNTANLIDRLAAIPDQLAPTVAGWTNEQLHAQPDPEGWSAAAILAHLRAADAIMSHRLYALLVRDNPYFLAFDERRWADVAGYVDADVATSLRLFALRRAELVTTLQRLPADAWQRTGTHEVTGTFTLVDGVRGFVEHEEEHCRQFEAVPVSRRNVGQ